MNNNKQIKVHPDLATIKSFISALGKKEKPRFRAFPHKDTPKELREKLRPKKLSNRFLDIRDAQREGLNIYLVVNDGGDKDKDIKRCVAYFVEFDGISEEEQQRKIRESGLPEPTIIIRTGGGSLHYYWVLLTPLEDIDLWKDDQKRLIAHLGSDPAIFNPSRVMRLAGCLYINGNQEPIAQTEIIHRSDQKHTREALLKSIPDLPRTYRKKVAYEKGSNQCLETDHPCVICGRPPDGRKKCAINENKELIYCHHGDTYYPPSLETRETIESNGVTYAKVGEGEDASGTHSVFKIHTPLVKAKTIEELFGTIKEGELVKPRTDQLTKVIELAVPLKYNELTQRIENAGIPVDGDFLGTLYLQLAENHQVEINKEKASDAALVVARRNCYHPVRDYLLGLEDELQIEDWNCIAEKCLGTNDPWAQIHLQRQLIGLVARAMKPGCKLDTALVIYSTEQGIGKSSMWQILGQEWFSDSLGNLSNLKDDKIQLHSGWIHEWGEIDSIVGKRKSETLKKFLSASKDDVRKPYGKGVETLHRSCGIVGTTNRDDFIKDPTGNRRFPIISTKKVNLDWIKTNRDLIWRSAYVAYSKGQRWYYTSEENIEISKAAMNFSAEDPIKNRVETWIEDNPDQKEVCIPVIAYSLDPFSKGDKKLSLQISRALRTLGWIRTDQRRRGELSNGLRHEKATVWERTMNVI